MGEHEQVPSYLLLSDSLDVVRSLVERVQQLEDEFEASIRTLAVSNEWMTDVAVVKDTMVGLVSMKDNLDCVKKAIPTLSNDSNLNNSVRS